MHTTAGTAPQRSTPRSILVCAFQYQRVYCHATSMLSPNRISIGRYKGSRAANVVMADAEMLADLSVLCTSTTGILGDHTADNKGDLVRTQQKLYSWLLVMLACMHICCRRDENEYVQRSWHAAWLIANMQSFIRKYPVSSLHFESEQTMQSGCQPSC